MCCCVQIVYLLITLTYAVCLDVYSSHPISLKTNWKFSFCQVSHQRKNGRQYPSKESTNSSTLWGSVVRPLSMPRGSYEILMFLIFQIIFILNSILWTLIVHKLHFGLGSDSTCCFSKISKTGNPAHNSLFFSVPTDLWHAFALTSHEPNLMPFGIETTFLSRKWLRLSFFKIFKKRQPCTQIFKFHCCHRTPYYRHTR